MRREIPSNLVGSFLFPTRRALEPVLLIGPAGDQFWKNYSEGVVELSRVGAWTAWQYCIATMFIGRE